MERVETINTNVIYNDKTVMEGHLSQLEVFVEKDIRGKEVYYVRESSLYALGDRNLAVNPESERLLMVSMEYLEKLIKLYEKLKPSMVIEIVKISLGDELPSSITLSAKDDLSDKELYSNEIDEPINEINIDKSKKM